MALTDNLIGFWELEETSGSRSDATASALTLTDNNTVTSNTGKVGTAAQFTAANSEYLSRTSEAALQTGDIDFSFQAWVYADSSPGGGASRIVIGKDVDSPGSSRDYTLDWYNDGSFLMPRFYINGGVAIVTSSSHLSTATWYHICCGHVAASDIVWIQVNNGTVDTGATGGAVPQTSGAQFRIGARAYSGFEGYWDGRIDQVGLWKRDIRSDVATLYNSGSGLSYAAMGGGAIRYILGTH
jgi:hypothetical protein